MEWVRKVSLVRRIVIGFSVLSVSIAATDTAAAWFTSLQAQRLAQWTDAARAAHVALPEGVAQWQSQAATAVWGFGAAALVGVVLALLAGWLIRSSIKDSVESTIACVVRIAGGDLETKIESPGRDEISWLRAELNGMRKKLRKAVLEVHQTVGSVNTASDEIASGNLDLSTRTETQASALQQTSSSIEQLAGSVRSNADSTDEARNEVAQSSAVAARGAEMMQDVIARMVEINASSHKISEIIGVIDGIAFQTNILALNAAVEAARAGEHGRGFAVVASEVRSLAQRSSTAAREIKVLIGDSSDKVDAGARLVNDAGRTMQDILDSVKRVSTLISSIAEAGRTQSTDISQVHDALSQLDTMTQQNAALVEELAASAQSLRGQSGRLSESMSSFRVVA
ncbi:MAG: HAMP domain-containing protein [Proteobacteria bacterium]|nr:HAMP domain-containing protein [Pseudomonadota bacterium]